MTNSYKDPFSSMYHGAYGRGSADSISRTVSSFPNLPSYIFHSSLGLNLALRYIYIAPNYKDSKDGTLCFSNIHHLSVMTVRVLWGRVMWWLDYRSYRSAVSGLVKQHSNVLTFTPCRCTVDFSLCTLNHRSTSTIMKDQVTCGSDHLFLFFTITSRYQSLQKPQLWD